MTKQSTNQTDVNSGILPVSNNNDLTDLAFESSTLDKYSPARKAALARMVEAGLPESFIMNFDRLYGQVESGITGVIEECQIEPVGALDELSDIQRDARYLNIGSANLDHIVVLRLNGGLGTGMGLDRAKSQLLVRESLSFNDIMAKQLSRLNEETGVSIPLIHMTSFVTDNDIAGVMKQYPHLACPGVPSTFQQHKHPKLYRDTLEPAAEANDDLNWNPPGHGDIYAALLATGIAEKLLDAGKRYAFVANSDNLGATLDPSILGYLIAKNAPFLMETAERTEADSKGGHLAKCATTGRYLLRETAQAPTIDGQILGAFSDISKYQHFNTNNLWIDLEKVLAVAKHHNGCIPLPLISNKKGVNPQKRDTREVIQIETAMGAAISVFDNSLAIRVPRGRFLPVKTNEGLLITRSDAVELNKAFHLLFATTSGNPPHVQLEPRFFGMLPDFEGRFQVIPSLKNATSFKVQGNVAFRHPLTIVGDVTIVGPSDRVVEVPEHVTRISDSTLKLP